MASSCNFDSRSCQKVYGIEVSHNKLDISVRGCFLFKLIVQTPSHLFESQIFSERSTYCMSRCRILHGGRWITAMPTDSINVVMKWIALPALRTFFLPVSMLDSKKDSTTQGFAGSKHRGIIQLEMLGRHNSSACLANGALRQPSWTL